MYGAGLRRSEAVSLELTDFDRETGALTVCGKGRKERTAYLDAGAREAIAVWLEYRGSERGPLLPPITRSPRAVSSSVRSGRSGAVTPPSMT